MATDVLGPVRSISTYLPVPSEMKEVWARPSERSNWHRVADFPINMYAADGGGYDSLVHVRVLCGQDWRLNALGLDMIAGPIPRTVSCWSCLGHLENSK